ncbi:MAG TPA: alpha/beta hydrolase [Cyclobacteriaceae bacterium]|nr:alpha/beta hydrolase [Cyclobacteriaceae bacterium]
MNFADWKAFIIICALPMTSHAQTTIDLYPGNIPNSKPSANEEVSELRDGITLISKITRPTLGIFLPSKEKANGTAVIICPGGGYWVNAISHEGTDVALQFTAMGVAAFVLKYRIPNDATMEKKESGPLQDAQQAIKIVRQQASEWNIDIHKVGIMGFSAGGHLASTAGTHFNKSLIANAEKINLRPDFMILIYPVISFQDSIAHTGSRVQLLGKHPSHDLQNYFSNELQVTKDTPPTFLVHATDDDGVKVENSLVFYQHLIAHKIPAELHTYQNGGHGFGLNNKTTIDKWMERCKNWMTSNGWMGK